MFSLNIYESLKLILMINKNCLQSELYFYPIPRNLWINRWWRLRNKSEQNILLTYPNNYECAKYLFIWIFLRPFSDISKKKSKEKKVSKELREYESKRGLKRVECGDIKPIILYWKNLFRVYDLIIEICSILLRL